MALTNLSQVTSSGIHTLSNYTTHNINSTGIITATSFSGNLSSASGISTFAEIRVTGNLTVEGTTTTLDSVLNEVDRLEIGANTAAVGLALTQSGSGHAATFEGGNFGIGTNNPAYALDVKQTDTTNPLTIAAKGGTDGGGYFWESNSGTTYGAVGYGKLITANSGSANSAITTWGSQDLLLGTNRVERLRITSGGFIGAGTASPRRHFHLHNSATATVGFQMTNGGTGESNDSQGFQLKVGSDGHAEIAQMENSNLRIFTNALERLRITSGGNFGIKNTSPNNTLTVGDTVQPSYAPSSAGNYIEIARTSGGDAGLLINKNTGQWLVGIDNTDGANSPLRFEYGAAGSAHPGFGSANPAMMMKHNGNIGIGTDNPQVQLHLTAADPYIRFQDTAAPAGYSQIMGTHQGAIAFSADYSNSVADSHLRFDVDGTERLRINSGGQVLVGTDIAPAYTNRRLTVATTSGTTAIEVRSATNGDGRIYFTDNTTSGNVGAYAGKLMYDHTDNYMAFHTGGDDATPGERLRITAAGNIGISDTSPENTLSIKNIGSFEGDANSFYLGSNFTGTGQNFSGSGKHAQRFFFNNASGNGYLRYENTGTSTGNAGDAITWQERFRIRADGTIRVGGDYYTDTSIQMSLKSSTTGCQIQMHGTGTGTASGDGLRVGYNGAGGQMWLFESGYIRFATSNVEKLRITDDGNVGINETTPYYKLHIKTNNNATSLSGGTSGNWGGDGIRIENTNATGGSMSLAHFRTYDADWHIGTKHVGTNTSNFIFLAESNERLRINSDGTIYVNSADSASGGRIYAASSKLYLQSGNGRQSFNISDMASGQSATHEFNSSGNLILAGSASAKNSVTLTDTDTSARLNVHTDLSGNYTGWKERNVASGSMSQASIDSKTPTLNDFTYPNNSNGMLIWSTSKIGFAAGGESPQYGTGVQMLFDSAGLMLGGLRAFDRTSSTSTSTNWNLKLNTAGSAVFKGSLEADPILLDGNDSWVKSTYGGISNSTVQSLNNLLIAQNMRGWIGTRDGGSSNNNFYYVTTHGGLGYCGTEYCYEGITKFYNNTGGSTANATFTPYERVRITSSRFYSSSGFHFSNNSSTNNSLPNPYNIGNISSNNVAYPHTPGMYLISASSPCDNTWRTLLTSINDSAFVFEGISGDASSKRSYKVIGNPTSPGYGVNRMSEDYNNGAWNTGDIEFRLDGSHPNWNLQVKTTSYYNSSNNAGIKFMLFVYY